MNVGGYEQGEEGALRTSMHSIAFMAPPSLDPPPRARMKFPSVVASITRTTTWPSTHACRVQCTWEGKAAATKRRREGRWRASSSCKTRWQQRMCTYVHGVGECNVQQTLHSPRVQLYGHTTEGLQRLQGQLHRTGLGLADLREQVRQGRAAPAWLQ